MTSRQYKTAVPPLIPPTGNFESLRVNDTIIGNLKDPIRPQDAATKSYVDSSSGGSPGGNNTEVQYNNNGTFAGDPNLTWNTGSGTLFVPNVTTTGTVTVQAPTNGTDAANKDYVDAATGSPGGNNTEVQYNNNGTFAGDSNFVWNSGSTTLFPTNINVSGTATVQTPTNGTDAANKDYVDAAISSPQGPDTAVQFNNAGNFAGSGNLTWDGSDLTVNGTIFSTNFQTTSDMGLKSNILSINNPIESIKKIKGYSYNLNENKGITYGVMAQEIENLNELKDLIKTTSNGTKTVDYQQFIPIIIECIKKLSFDIEVINNKRSFDKL